MDWIRGGTWEVEEDSGERVARIRQMAGAKSLFAPSYDAAAFFSDRPRWNRTVGSKYGLEVYSPRVAEGDDVFEFIAAQIDKFPVDSFPDDGSPLDPDPTTALLRLLGKFGPFGSVAGIIERGDVDRAHLRGLNLYRFFLEAKEFAERFRQANTFQKGGTPAPRWAALALRHLGDNYNISWYRGGEGVSFSAQPVTMRGLLWARLLGLVAGSHRFLCGFCKHPFEVLSNRGRPPAYCARHKPDRFRKMAQRGTADRYLQEHPEECVADADHV